MSGPPPEPRQRVGNYEILEEIGRGATGVVCRARDLALDRIVALKMLSAHVGRGKDARKRILREAELAAKLEHPSLVSVYDVGVDEGQWYLAMEFIEGGPLAKEIRARRKEGHDCLAGAGRDVLVGVLLRFAEVADALHLAHESEILHRDVNPRNILVDRVGVMKLVDFGLARDLSAEGASLSGDPVGTPVYASPEQISPRRGRPDRRSDVYSLGATLYELVTFRKPFEGGNLAELSEKIRREDPPLPRSLGLEVPPELEAIIFKAMEKDPRRRYQTAKALGEDLRRFVDYRTVEAQPQSVMVRLRKWLRRSRQGVAATLIAVLAVAALVVAPTIYGRMADWRRRVAKEEQRAEMESRATELWERAKSQTAEEAAATLTEIIRRFPDSRRVQAADLRRGNLWMGAKEREKAQAAWAEALIRDPEARDGQEAFRKLTESLYEEGNYHLASDAARNILARTPPGLVRSRVLLLAASIALGLGRYSEAAWYLEECEAFKARLEAGDRDRLGRLRDVMDAFLPPREFDLGPCENLIGGLFRRGEQNLVVVGKDGARLYLCTRSGMKLDRTLDLEVPSRTAYLGKGDLDGDGIEELIWAPAIGHDPLWNWLRVLSLAGEELRTLFWVQVPNSDLAIRVGDADNDGRPDILVGGSYPRRWVGILINDSVVPGRLRFSWLSPGPLEGIHEGYSDVRDLAVGDLDGDGRNEFLIAAEAHRLHTLYVCRIAGRGAPCEILHRVGPGYIHGCRILDIDGDGRGEAYFSTALYFYHYAEEQGLLEKMIPQGVYALDWEPEAKSFRLLPLDVHRRIRRTAEGPLGLPPANFGFGPIHEGRHPATGPFGALWCHFTKSAAERSVALKIYTFSRGPGPGVAFGGPVPQPRGRMLTMDFDGDGDTEILRAADGRLLVLGLPGVVEPHPPPRSAGDLVAAKSGVALRLDVAHWLADMELRSFARRELQRIVMTHDGRPEGREALESLIATHGSAGEYESALVQIEELSRRYPKARSHALLLRTQYLERLWKLSEAAREYQSLVAAGRLDAAEHERAVRKSEETEPWLATAAAPLSNLEGWSTTDPGAFPLAGTGRLVVEDNSLERRALWSPHVWRGGRFQLSFDLRVDELGWGRGLFVGFFRHNGLEEPRPVLRFHTGNTSTIPAGGSLGWYGEEYSLTDSWGGEQWDALPHGETLRIVMTYDAHRAGLILYREDGTVFRSCELDPLHTRLSTPARLVIWYTCSTGSPSPLAFEVGDFEIRYPSDQGNPLTTDEWTPPGAVRLRDVPPRPR